MRIADGVESYVPQLEYGLDTEVMQRESSLVIPQAEQEDEDHADNLSESSRDESDDEKEAWLNFPTVIQLLHLNAPKSQD